MKHLWALSSTLVLSTVVVVSGVAAGATTRPDPAGSTGQNAGQMDRTSQPAARTWASTAAADGFYWQLTAPQDVVSGTFLRAGGGRAANGTRSDQQFFQISRTGSSDVPEAALRAYRRAETAMASADADCRISWTLLAAIGRVESNHGRFGGSQLGSDGVSRPAIRGPRLDGAGPFAAIRDSDDGALDLDRVWDRAVGQMQFLPETWHSVARDGDGDGLLDPQDIDDSALSSAVYLCGAGGSLADPAGMSRAAFRYNHSDYYVSLVLAFQSGYQSGVFALPSPPPPPTSAAPAVAVKQAPTAQASVPRVRTPKLPEVAPVAPTRPVRPAPRPAPRPTPRPTLQPSTPPAPAAPKLVTVTGTWAPCFATYCLGSTPLDLGLGNRGTATADFDTDGQVETNGEEFAGLVGRPVTVSGERRGGGLVVYVLGEHGLRNLDGTFARPVTSQATTP